MAGVRMVRNKNYTFGNKVNLELKQPFKVLSLVHPPVTMSLQSKIFATEMVWAWSICPGRSGWGSWAWGDL